MGPKIKAQPQAVAEPAIPVEYRTVKDKLEAEYLESRPYEVLKAKKGFGGMSAAEKSAYANYIFLETGVWKNWAASQQKDFWALVEKQKIPLPLPKPQPLGKDFRGRDLETYTPQEYQEYQKKQTRLRQLEAESKRWREIHIDGDERIEEFEEEESQEVEKQRRKEIGDLRGKAMGRYESDPTWDDVKPIPQDDGEGALAQIAYTDEYSEAMGYLRAIMAANEHTPRVLGLTEHIIGMNAAHYTVWLYRASTLFALNSSIAEELKWLNEVALVNQKNYQIWHHRQLLIDQLYTTISSSPSDLEELAKSELDFMMQMFAEDSKNYHVWSYRQYLVRKLDLFSSAPELASVEALLREDVRNNSAWSHRFFIVFSNPSYCTPTSKATEPDPAIPAIVIDRELNFAKAATFEAPQNQSPWNYLRGVLRKADRKLSTEEEFASQFVQDLEEDTVDIKSSHALDFLADVWEETGEVKKADRALTLLGDTFDRVRKNYWEWRRKALKKD
ncbi:hypothetical protein BP5796_09105 [Coleophoma crateriformis]|uniref:Protein farnesyltransferase/geranylgeranyltransferase type-1 subunit alpha n=1 Tax=Coleophoma crateriformis TaxID=565419 RepID=A0A3D8R3B2_9HELO|nr:hypothetical protein BP5796_09105 [Coleophoma crateriformis]